MVFLADSNVIVRLIDVTSAQHEAARRAVANILARGDAIVIVLQNLYEFWAVCIGPIANNGLGMSTADTSAAMNRIRVSLTYVPDDPTVPAIWETRVTKHAVTGFRCHDARLVAAMSAAGVGSILTFNSADFRVYPGISIIDPTSV